MKNWLKYIEEKEYVIYDAKFIKNIEEFVFKNDKKYLRNIAKVKSKIPIMFRKPQVLYRGMKLSLAVIQDIQEGKNLILDDFSSWTKDAKMAERFISDRSKAMKETGTGVVFKKKFDKKIILDIQGLIMFLDGSGRIDDFDEGTKDDAIEEAEVIVDKGIKLSKKDIFKIIK